MVAEYSVWQQGMEVNYAALCEEKKDGLHILRLMCQIGRASCRERV